MAHDNRLNPARRAGMARKIAVALAFGMAASAWPTAAQAGWCNALQPRDRAKFSDTVAECGSATAVATVQIAAIDPVAVAEPIAEAPRLSVSFAGLEAPSPAVTVEAPIVDQVAARFAIDPLLLRAVVAQESGGRANAVSPKGAIGLMQVMPETARSLGIADPRALRDPLTSLQVGATFLKLMQSRFGNNLALTLAAYNAGPGAVQRWRGVPPYRETRAYVARILARYRQARTAAASRAGA